MQGDSPRFSVSTEASVARGVKLAAKPPFRFEVFSQRIGDADAALHAGIRGCQYG
jgi:hypothetical protein